MLLEALRRDVDGGLKGHLVQKRWETIEAEEGREERVLQGGRARDEGLDPDVEELFLVRLLSGSVQIGDAEGMQAYGEDGRVVVEDLDCEQEADVAPAEGVADPPPGLVAVLQERRPFLPCFTIQISSLRPTKKEGRTEMPCETRTAIASAQHCTTVAANAPRSPTCSSAV